jgi:lipoprotein NlpD
MSQSIRLAPPILHLRPLSRLAAAALVVLVAACASRAPAPVEERATQSPRPAPTAAAPAPVTAAPEPEARPQTYTVKRGDMLYKIALDHGLDYRELAAWNSIENVNLIREGQVLRLAPPVDPNAVATIVPGAGGVTTVPLRSAPPPVAGEARQPPAAGTTAVAPTPVAPPGTRNTESYKSQPKALKEPYSEQALRDIQRSSAAVAAPASVAVAEPSAPPPVIARAEPRLESKPEPKSAPMADDDDKLGWIWPASGKLVTGGSENPNLKGIDIAGRAGQPVVASAAGKVVYSGTGIRGYGKLIIVKHNATYLSAYAHNQDILVKEGQQVARGQKIAEMGSTDADQVKLHFEIRKHGTPMDPLKFLPPA